MTSNQFMIGPIKDGVRKDIKPFAIPEDAFETLINAYQFRGRVVRKPGYTSLNPEISLTSRLSPDGITFPGNPVMGLRTREQFAIGQQQLIAFDTTASYTWNGTNFITLASTMPVTWNGSNSQFFWSTNYSGGFWATNSNPGLNGVNVLTVSNTNPAVVTTTIPHGFSNNQFVTMIDVLGYAPLATSTPIFNGQVFQIAAVTPTTFELVGLNGTLYSGFSSNGIALNSQVAISGQDGIRYYAQTTVGNTWVNYNPPIDPFTALAGALLIFPYRGYLVFLNTYEGNDTGVLNYPNRARWTAQGTPYYSQPAPISPNIQGTDPLTARDDVFGRGGAIDASTSETIVGAGFIRDILVVYFERSTWRLRYTNNSQDPFAWERINVEFGADCTFSTITFDKGLMAIGNRGIVLSDANDVVRFDEKIPDDVFDIRQANEGFQRVYGIRTFEKRLCFWTYPSVSNKDGIFPDKILVFNYDTKNWSYFDDCFTCFGYFYPTQVAETWADMTTAWQDINYSWDSGLGSLGNETIIAGNQQGYVFSLNQTGAENSPSLSISDITSGVVTSTNHNLPNGSWIKLTGVTGTTSADGVSLNNRYFKVAGANSTSTPNTFKLTEFKPIEASPASPLSTELSYTYSIDYAPIIPTSVVIWIGTDKYTDNNGILSGPNGLGIIDYTTGSIALTFVIPYTNTPVNIYVVAFDDEQSINPVDTITAYTGGGEITKVSNFLMETKYFNFFQDDKRARLSKIDFYTNQTGSGQFTCKVLADSSDLTANTPLPDNLQSNIVLTTESPYQFGSGEQTMYRLFADVLGQSLQFQLTMQDRQMGVQSINSASVEILAMIMTMKRGGRIV